MKKVYIVTGGSGFLGNHVVKKLEEAKQTVVVLARNKEKTEAALAGTTASIVYGSVLSLRMLDKLFSVYEKAKFCFIHISSVVYLGKDRGEISKMYDINVGGIKNVIDICKKHQCRLVYISSVHALPEKSKKEVISEICTFDEEKIKGHYGKAKAEASRYVLEAVKNDKLDAVVVHPSGIIGPGDFSNTHTTHMIQAYKDGQIPAAVNGGYDFVDVRDVADGIIAAADRGRSGECYLLTNKYYSVKEILKMLYSLGVGTEIKVKVPVFWAKLSLPFAAISNKIKKRRALYDSNLLYALGTGGKFSHKKATQELGYKPRDIKESLRDALVWLDDRDKQKENKEF